MRIYFRAAGKIFKDGINISFSIIDGLAVLVGIIKPEYLLKWYVYLILFIVGYVIAAVKIVADNIKFPEVVIYLRGKGPKRKLRIRNISNMNLRDVEFDDIDIGDNPGEITLHFELAGDTNFLKSDEERDIDFAYSVEGKLKRDNFFFANLDPKYANVNYEMQIRYIDVPGNKYRIVYSIGRNKINLLKPPRLI